jgi:hypothetical protein
MSRFSIPRLYAGARENITLTIIVGSAFTVAVLPSDQVWIGALFWAAATGFVLVMAQLKTSEVCRRFGELLEFVFLPTPMGSVFASLSKHGVPPESIKDIKLMSSGVSESLAYYQRHIGGPSLLDVLSVCPDMRVTVYGPDPRPDTVRSGHPQIDLVITTLMKEEHTNLIIAKDDQAYIWFEPYHTVVAGHHYFTRGAYLLKVKPSVREETERMFASLPRYAAPEARHHVEERPARQRAYA